MAGAAPGFQKHPDYEVTIEPVDHHVEVRVGETVIASTDAPVLLRETKHRPVLYVPWDDLVHAELTKTETDTFCPFKGHASYWSVSTPGGVVQDALWRYEDPFDECLAIRDYVAFYTNKVTVEVDGEVQDRSGPGWV